MGQDSASSASDATSNRDSVVATTLLAQRSSLSSCSLSPSTKTRHQVASSQGSSIVSNTPPSSPSLLPFVGGGAVIEPCRRAPRRSDVGDDAPLLPLRAGVFDRFKQDDGMTPLDDLESTNRLCRICAYVLPPPFRQNSTVRTNNSDEFGFMFENFGFFGMFGFGISITVNNRRGNSFSCKTRGVNHKIYNLNKTVNFGIEKSSYVEIMRT